MTEAPQLRNGSFRWLLYAGATCGVACVALLLWLTVRLGRVESATEMQDRTKPEVREVWLWRDSVTEKLDTAANATYRLEIKAGTTRPAD